MPDEKEKQQSTRREFLKKAAFSGAAVTVLGGFPSLPTLLPTNVPEVPEASGQIVHNADLCAGCCSCMAACSLSHHGAVSRELSGIQIMSLPREGAVVEANTCKQCQGPECLYACPTGALHVDTKTKARVIDASKCTGCQACLQACPNKASNSHYYGIGLSPIRYDAEKKVCFKCDLCGGDPQCVRFCPMKALTFQKKGV